MKINVPLPNPSVSFCAMISGGRQPFLWCIVSELDARQVVRFPQVKKFLGYKVLVGVRYQW
ncbi:hypothetical protein NC651_000634 [Populus alba x Populus x berolinensis]|nr:hypothetical protein NC651_000634 [Populus alba x Populus x berolinensis]